MISSGNKKYVMDRTNKTRDSKVLLIQSDTDVWGNF